MKQFYLFFLAILMSSVAFGQEMLTNGNFEAWDDANTPSGWTHVENVTQEVVAENVHGETYAVKHVGGTKDLGQLITGIVPGDHFTLSLWYKVEAGTGDGTDIRIWSKWSNDGAYDHETDKDLLQGPGGEYFDNNGSAWTQYTVDLTAPSNANEFYFEVRTYGSTVVYWDDFSFYKNVSSTPAISITSPSNDKTFDPGTTGVAVNYTTANTSGSETVDITVNGTKTAGIAGGTYTVTTTDGQSYDVKLELLDGDSVVDSKTVSFSVAAITQVNTLADLRAATVGEVYEETGEIVNTYSQSKRNQKWFQDATAGILIDDNDNVISTTYNEGDIITGLKGKLKEYNGVLQLIPVSDPGVASGNQTVDSKQVTLLDFAADIDKYESMLVKVLDVTISDIDGGDGTFQAGKSYTITDPSLTATDTGVLRTNFSAADYIGSSIPTVQVPVIAIAGEYKGTAQIYPRSLQDFSLKVNGIEIEGFSIHPNPVKNTLYINTKANAEKQVEIYNLVGKQVLQTTVKGQSLNVDLPTGIYIINVEENGKTASQKLIVK